MSLVLVLILILLLFGGLPQLSGGWHNYGYGPSGVVFVILVIVAVLIFTGRF
jgi:hypothetical protein